MFKDELLKSLSTKLICFMSCFVCYLVMKSHAPFSATTSVFMPLFLVGSSTSLYLTTLSLFVLMMILLSMSMKSMKSMTFYCTALIFPLVFMFFNSDSLFVFYIMYEMTILPTYYMVVKGGYQPERIRATYYFFLYTVFASLPLLAFIVLVETSYCSSSLLFMKEAGLWNSNLLFMAMVSAFLVKVPLWGAHLWLPKAHVEAPVEGSMLLAGVLLKLGGFGMIVVMVMTYSWLCDCGALYLVFGLSLWGSVAVSVMILTLTDMKMIIAYSSVIHTNLMVVGFLSLKYISVFGALAIMMGHGFTSPGMFSLANSNYDKTQSRNLLLQKGFSSTLILWYVFVSSNMAAPPSLNFVGELTILMGVKMESVLYACMMGVVMLLSTGYNMYLFSSQQSNFGLSMVPSKGDVSCVTLSVFSLGFLMVAMAGSSSYLYM